MQRSTRQTDRKAALEICFLWEKASEKARRHELTAAAGRRVIAEMVSISSGEVLEFHSVEGWIRSWLAGKKGSTASATYAKYEQTCGSFLSHLGKRAGSPLGSVSPKDIATYRDSLRAEGRSVHTCNIARTIVSIPFAAARRQGLIAHNPCEAVDNLRTSSAGGLGGREAFTLTELSALVAGAEGDWKGAILLGATSGLRLGDIVRLQWGSVNLETDPETGLLWGLLRIETAKTGVLVVVPMHKDFIEWLSSSGQAGLRGIGKAYVFPDLAGKRIGGTGGLSSQFGRLVEKAGITRRITPGEGRGRRLCSKTFHSLRHTYISELANSGVISEIRQKLVGHSDSGVHKKYTHHELKVLRDAVARLPSIGSAPSA
jgi:integrase